jgi:fumarylacetoacetase
MPAPTIDATHNPSLQSWVESANDPATDFPIQNLPLCAFLKEHDGHAHAHYATIIGDQVLDVSLLLEAGYFDQDEETNAPLIDALLLPYGSGLLSSADARRLWRVRIQEFLRDGHSGGQQLRRLRGKALQPLESTTFVHPVATFNYTDFYASVHHATNVGSMFRPDNALLPNYKHVPIGYHGRASSIVLSGQPVKRPSGQQAPPDSDPAAGPTFGPCKMLDYELEVGVIIADGNTLGEPISIKDAHDHIFGLCLVNDWSARDMQKWEYQPLGPFLAKNFATTVSNCVVMAGALEPFRCALPPRPTGDPKPLPYLSDETDQALGGFDVTLEVLLQTRQMAEKNIPPHRLSKGSLRDMYWTFSQMIAHHTSNGCNLQDGDLLASGTVSGPSADSRGCLLELTWQGHENGKPRPRKPIELPSGETRTFLADGDTVVIKGSCEREGFRRIGFGECKGTIVG